MSALLIQPDIVEQTETLKPSLSAESSLVDAARHDPEALSQLYRQNHSRIFRYVLRRVGNRALTEDLVADVFVSMVRYLPRYRISDVPFHAWLYRLATNRVNRWARWQRRRAFRELRETACPRRDQQQQEMADHVRTALLTLPLPFQTTVALHYLEDMSLAEISQVLDCSIGTVKSRLARGRDMLRAQLNESDGDR
ncbi:MAG TPA: sigma-70 family RNA polymerase sigma factor [Gemmatales bacterium]|nr:sigma-70 family RNA polymerase sigma factor [Gemmatales bacterium]